MKFFKSIFYALRDLVLLTFPIYLYKDRYRYGFLIHPRDEHDVLIKYSFAKYVPYPLLRFLLRLYWPITVTKVTGLKTLKTKKAIDGFIFSIPLITTQILEDRKLALKKIRQAMTLAKRMGVKIIGLGALTASITKGGEDLLDIENIWITTGHAYTGFNVTNNLFRLESKLHIKKSRDVIAIVGAAGSIGSISAQLIARAGYKNIILVDVVRKKERVEETASEAQRLNPNANIEISYNLGDIIRADFIIAATNTPEALITSDLLKKGAVVIDDAQPSDVAYEVLERDDVMAIEAGVVETPGITSNFNLGLKGIYDNFCCMAEVLVLASHAWQENFVIKKTTLEFVDKIAHWSEDLDFSVGRLQNRKEYISESKFNRIVSIRKDTLQFEAYDVSRT